MDPVTPTPSTGRIAAIGGINLATTIAKAAAGFAVGHGWLASSNTETVVGLGVLALTYGYSFWKDYGRDIAVAALTILRAKVLNAAAAARQDQVSPTTALAKLETHVVETAPAAKAA